MITLLPEVRARDWQPRLGEIGAVATDMEDIAQAIRIIVTTPRGSDPHRPLFGADVLQYIDTPEIEAAPRLINDVADAILAWEPRVTLVSITPTFGLAQISLAIVWTRRSAGASQITTEVTL
jgi:phage baseplate assembly protein W